MSDGEPTVIVEDDRTGMDPATLRRAVLDHLYYSQAKDLPNATRHDVYRALSFAVRDRLIHRWIQTQRAYRQRDPKRVYYLSLEYLLGRQLEANLLNLRVLELAREALAEHGLSLDEVLEEEPDPGLGNGGLGRLAACFIDSMATLDLAGYGYGIRYEYGIFRQSIEDGYQVERPDDWLRRGNPWELARPEYTVSVPFGGYVEHGSDDRGHYRPHWVPSYVVDGVPYDTPVAGYGAETVNNLRLWAARSSDAFNLEMFNAGDFRRAVEGQALSETISRVLYPNDESEEGRKLRLKQQFFFVCCSIQDILRRFLREHDDLDLLPSKVTLQLNDTHPSLAVPELMRRLVDQHGLPWERAWEITRGVCNYTNHTLMPEALETWPAGLLGYLLPRHLQIIQEIDRRFLIEVHHFAPRDPGRLRRMAIVEPGSERIRMSHLSIVGSSRVNGVAALHSQLVRTQLLPEFAELWPDRFVNVTNGVTPRRWLLQCNPQLAAALTRRLGAGWETHLDALEDLALRVDDEELLQELLAIKAANKAQLAAHLGSTIGARIDPGSLFDVQVKRIHEYKRQLLNCLHVVALYARVCIDGEDILPRTVLIGGKAAPGYRVAKEHIKLIGDVADVVNNDPAVGGRLRLYFMPDYNVSLAQRTIPAADLSEQISTAGREASGTGNMKLLMNGALTIGTLDGANVEILEAVGAENFFLFGLDVHEVQALQARGYDPGAFISRSPELSRAIDLIEAGVFSPDSPGRHHGICAYLRHRDPYLVCADFDAFVEAQRRVEISYRDRREWARSVVVNMAASGRFSSDRSIRDYASRIWGVGVG